MNAILGFTNMVLRREGDRLSEKQQGNLSKVMDAGNRLLGLINDLLDLSKVEAGRMDVEVKRFDVAKLVRNCCAEVEPLLVEKPDVKLLCTESPHWRDMMRNLVQFEERLIKKAVGRRVLSGIMLAIFVSLVFVSNLRAQTAADTDFDGSGTVDFADFIVFAAAFGTDEVRYDVDGNGTVDFPDFIAFAQFFGEEIPSTMIVVTISADSGPGSLRQALLDATPRDVITFDSAIFPPEAPVTISLVKPLPEVGQGHLTIDASDAGVVIDGSVLPESKTEDHMVSASEPIGLCVVSKSNVIRGLHIRNFFKAGIALYDGARNNTIGGGRTIGEGPSGQGNMINGKCNTGIGFWSDGASHNRDAAPAIGSACDRD